MKTLNIKINLYEQKLLSDIKYRYLLNELYSNIQNDVCGLFVIKIKNIYAPIRTILKNSNKNVRHSQKLFLTLYTYLKHVENMSRSGRKHT